MIQSDHNDETAKEPLALDWLNMSTEQVAEAAARRAIQAMSRVGTLRTEMQTMTTDVHELQAEVAILRQTVGDLVALIESVLPQIEEARTGAEGEQ